MRTFLSKAKNDETKRILPIVRTKVMEWRNELGHCPFCSHPIDDTTVHYTVQASVQALHKLYQWCGENKRHEFKMSEVRHLLDNAQYNNLNYLDRFGGIVYRPMKDGKERPGWYGIHMERAKEFFGSKRKAPIQITYNRFTRERMAVVEGYIREFPDLAAFIDAEGNYNPEGNARLPLSTTGAN